MTTEQESARKWFSAESEDAEIWEGPFGSREEAVEQGHQNYGGAFWIDQGDPTTVDDAVQFLDLDELTESLEQNLVDNDLTGDDSIISWRDRPAAAAALEQWARDHMVVDPWYCMIGQAERIEAEP
jgi:hypothetical protein